MGGRRSGRILGWGGLTCESLRALDVRRLARDGLLVPGIYGWSGWERNGESSGFVNHTARETHLTLHYRVREPGEEWESVDQAVQLTHTHPHLGGSRVWFRCPRCSRRCAKLYGGRRFVCRICIGATYASQQENEVSRMISQAQEIRRRLGGSTNLSKPRPERPKGMHRRTYLRHMCKLAYYEERYVEGMSAYLERRHKPLD